MTTMAPEVVDESLDPRDPLLRLSTFFDDGSVELLHERDRIAALRAEWGELDNPARIEPLAKRYLQLKPIAPAQFDSLDQLPDRPPQFIKPDSQDPIGVIIENLAEPGTVTGSVSAPATTPAENASEAGTQSPAANPEMPSR